MYTPICPCLCLSTAMLVMTMTDYRICGIIDKSNIWRIALKMQLASILNGGFEYCMGNPCLYSLNGVHLIWKYRRDSPNCQIKATSQLLLLLFIVKTIITDKENITING